MPESVRDRCTKAHEYLFLLSKSGRYYYDAAAIAEPHAESSIERAKNPANPRRRGTGTAQEKGVLSLEWNPEKVILREGGRNKRSVWTVATHPYKEAHFATFPPKLIEPCILAGCPVGGTVLDPFNGSGTTGLVALQHGRHYVGIELSREYCDIAAKRMERELSQPMLFDLGLEPQKAEQGSMFEEHG